MLIDGDHNSARRRIGKLDVCDASAITPSPLRPSAVAIAGPKGSDKTACNVRFQGCVERSIFGPRIVATRDALTVEARVPGGQCLHFLLRCLLA